MPAPDPDLFTLTYLRDERGWVLEAPRQPDRIFITEARLLDFFVGMQAGFILSLRMPLAVTGLDLVRMDPAPSGTG